MLQPRAYQQTAHDELWRRFDGGAQRVVLVGPTGMGKTVQSALSIARVLERGGKVAFLAHRTELLEQPAALLESALPHVDFGFIKSGHSRKRPWAPVQIASVQTLQSMLKRGEALPSFDLVVIDECHRAKAKGYLAILQEIPGQPKVLGLTATPWRLDGKPLGDVFESMVVAATPAELVAGGYLIAPRRCVPRHCDWGSAKSDKALADSFAKSEIHGHVVQDWLRHALGRSTIVFACSVERSKQYVEEFRAAGVRAEHVDGSTPAGIRKRLMDELRAGTLTVLCNVNIAVEGLDAPIVSCVSLARPTYSLTMYLQMVGRCMRPAPGKTDALILDHAALTLPSRHGLPLEHREWSLDGEARTGGGSGAPRLAICGECFEVTELPAPCCSFCSAPWGAKRREGPVEAGGELVDTGEEVSICEKCCRGVILIGHTRRDGKRTVSCGVCGWSELQRDEAATAQHGDDRKVAHFERLVGQARAKGYRAWWIAKRYCAVYGGPEHVVAAKAAERLGRR